MKIKFKDDKKGKAQSVDAEYSIASGNSWNWWEANLEGVGVDEWSAKMNLVEAAEKLIIHLQELVANNKN